MTAVALGAAGGCSSPSPNGSSVSFSNTLMPLFQQRCATTQTLSCHGDRKVEGTVVNGLSNQPRPYLGPSPLNSVVQQDIDDVYNGLKNVLSSEAPTLVYVDPGNPDASFLWHKVSNDLNSILTKCTTGMNPPCGLVMPNDNTTLSTADQDEILSWIQSGAPKN
jgi:hypothetical protein